MRPLRLIKDLLLAETLEVTGCTEGASVAFAFRRARRQLRQPLDPMTERARLDTASDVPQNASTATRGFAPRLVTVVWSDLPGTSRNASATLRPTDSAVTQSAMD